MKHVILSAALALAPNATYAASILFSLNAETTLFERGSDAENISKSGSFATLTDAIASSSVEAAFTPRFGTGEGSAAASYDINRETGAFKFGAVAEIEAVGGFVDSDARGEVSLTLSETFSITGTGDITFRLGIEGLLSNTGSSRFADQDSSIDAAMRLMDESGVPTTLGSDSFRIVANEREYQIIDDVLEFTTTITESQDYLFLMRLSAVADTSDRGFGNSSGAAADFFNTAFLSFEADDTLTVTASDARFLSGASDPLTPVPLPASAWLLVASLGLLRLSKSARSRA